MISDSFTKRGKCSTTLYTESSAIIKHLSKGRKKTANNDKRNNESILSKKSENALKSNGLNDFYLAGNNTVNGKM